MSHSISNNSTDSVSTEHIAHPPTQTTTIYSDKILWADYLNADDGLSLNPLNFL